MPPLRSPRDVDAWLDSRGLFHMDLTLDRIQACLAQLGLAETPWPVLQVVGSNGKGSTAVMLAHLAGAHGLRAGLFTSPHFLHPRERLVTVDDFGPEPIDDEDWLRAGQAVLETEAGPELTYFELTLAMALWWFRDMDVDVAVLEAGLGGAHDATTAVAERMVCFTPIGMEHAGVLGDTLGRIARDKAQAIPQGGVALSVPQAPQAMFQIEREATRKQARLLEVRPPRAFDPDFGFYPLPDPLAGQGPAPIPLGLAGAHQAANARLATAAWVFLCGEKGWRVDSQDLRRGLRAAFLPGRLQRVAASADAPASPASRIANGPPPRPALLLDAAHNAPALASLEAALPGLGCRPKAMVFTCLADKDLTAMGPILARLTTGPVLVPELPDVSRARPAVEVATALAPWLGERVRPMPDVAAALAAIAAHANGSGPALVCGSIYLLAACYALFPQALGPWRVPLDACFPEEFA